MEYREECRKQGKDVSPDGFMFPGRFGGPMDTGNFRKRVLHRLADELEPPKLTFQVIRRRIATLGKVKAHPKDIQGMMRHSRLATTMEVYMQSLEPEVRTAQVVVGPSLHAISWISASARQSIQPCTASLQKGRSAVSFEESMTILGTANS